jgi:cell division transport system ATP-binding protein
MSSGAELGSVRKCRFAVRARPGDSARPYFPDSGAFLPVSHRPLGRRQDLAAAAVVSVDRPTRGLVNLFGQDVSLLGKDQVANMRQRIGIVLQDFRLLDHMTTYENVALPFRVMGREESSYRREVIDLLKWVGLGERMDALPPILSGGEKQRAAIARAVISRPQLLLADEPTGSVDPTLGRRLLRLFIELNRLGTAVIIATHDITLMDQYEARRMVLHQGRLHIYE